VSVGHVARAFEEASMATVTLFVRAFRHVAEDMMVPRVVLTRHPMGRPLGAPGDVVRQRQVILAALRLLDEARGGGSIVELPERYRVPTARQ
jgi:hypothetical protein